MKSHVLLVGAWVVAGCGDGDVPVSIEVWHGNEHVIGASGLGQPDHNVMGIATGNDLTWSLDGSPEQPLVTGEGEWGFRRLGGPGHFNIELPVASIAAAGSEVTIRASNSYESAEHTVTVRRVAGEATLPMAIDWSEVESVHDVGQPVDGEWELTPAGLRSREPLYDRLFLFGTTAWRDYDVRTTVTVNAVPKSTGPKSGGPGVGVIPRFAGHTIAPPRFPEATPKWGYQPFGAILWLRFRKGAPEVAPVRQFYRGDRDESSDHGALEGFEVGVTYALRASCVTKDDPHTTIYRFKVWRDGEPEPGAWDFEVTQTSPEARRAGGAALVVHHLDVTFGDILIDER